MNKKAIKSLVGGKFFSVVFTKTNGSKRKMLCKLVFKRLLKGGKAAYVKPNRLPVVDVKLGQFRSINLDTLEEIKVDGKTYKIV
jgi:hypothetical protein